MSLRDIQYQEDYRSGYDNIVEDFFHPSGAGLQGPSKSILGAQSIYWLTDCVEMLREAILRDCSKLLESPRTVTMGP